MKKILSLIMVTALIIPLTALTQAEEIQLQIPAGTLPKTQEEASTFQIEKFVEENKLENCLIGDENQSFSKNIRIDEAVCIFQKGNLGIEKEDLPQINEYRQKGVSGLPPKTIAPYYFEAQLKGIISNEKPGQTISEAQLYNIALRFNGYTLPPPASTEKKYLDISRNDLQFRPAIHKAIELTILIPKKRNIIGLKQTASRLDTFRIAYLTNLINSADRSLISQKQAQLQLENTEKLDILLDVIRLIQNAGLYKDKLDLTPAIKAIMDSLEDPYSKYFIPSENKQFMESVSGKFQGIGAYIDEADEYIQIISPLPNSPAEKAGVHPGDIITEVDGKSTKGMTVQEAVKIIKGPSGTEVTLTIKRNGSSLKIPITRAEIVVPAITAEEKNGITILNLANFNSQAVEGMRKEIEKINKTPPKALIINVQNNPGGFLNSVVQILDMFTEKDTVLVRTQYPDFSQFTRARTSKLITQEIPIYIMINKGSASASEILAATMKDYGLATIVGSTSFGKGTVQTVTEFYDGSSAKLTIAEWLSGRGSSINQKGVDPDTVAPDNLTTKENETLEWIIQNVNNPIRTNAKSKEAIR
jgi:carboxyl-terminal processing protease